MGLIISWIITVPKGTNLFSAYILSTSLSERTLLFAPFQNVVKYTSILFHGKNDLLTIYLYLKYVQYQFQLEHHLPHTISILHNAIY